MQLASDEISVIDKLVEQLKHSSDDQQRIQLIAKLKIDLGDLRAYHYLGEKSYGRNLIFSNDDFEVILMCWSAGQGTIVHDHSESLCVMQCVDGELDEQRYIEQSYKEEMKFKIKPSQLSKLTSGETRSITDQDGLHSIKNNSSSAASSLHFYFPPIHNVTLYNLEEGVKKTASGVFTSEYGVLK
ncbi:MAG: cysteine dioxygenase [Oceanospirillaceae bacterium]|jgi:cysteine dioxygenase